MYKIIKESFNITNKNIIIATPLIFFSLISSLYMIFSVAGSNIGLLLSMILFFLMFAAFLSGWFFMIFRAIKEPEIQDNQLIMEFPAGVGVYFIPVVGMIFLITVISLAIGITALIIGKKYIGGFGISYSQFSQAATSVETMRDFIGSLSSEQLSRIRTWNILAFCTLIFNYFVLMLYPAILFFKERNPFKAVFVLFKDSFGYRFFRNAALFLFIFILYTLISIATVLIGNNIFIHFILTLVNFYYITFAGILIFNYYYSSFIKIGSNIDTAI